MFPGVVPRWFARLEREGGVGGLLAFAPEPNLGGPSEGVRGGGAPKGRGAVRSPAGGFRSVAGYHAAGVGEWIGGKSPPGGTAA